MHKKLKLAEKRGFTLIEILIVIGIIAILAGIVLVAINPARQFRQANNTQRQSNVNAILNAIGQYTVDHKGEIPTEITGTAQEIKDDGADLCGLLVPTYLPAFPADPSLDDQSITQDECEAADEYNTEYFVKEEDGRIIISAPKTEDVDEDVITPEISVTR